MEMEGGMRRMVVFRGILISACVAIGVNLGVAADLPKDDTSSLAPPAQAAYQMGPEDVIDVFVWKEPELTATVMVRPDGKVSLPLAGELAANGKTAVQLQQEIVERLKRYINDPVVNVIIKEINSLKISVLGEVHKPDVYRIKTRVTVLDAIAMAGGFTDLAKPNRILILQNTPTGQHRVVVNINELVANSKGARFYLEPFDTVYVEGR